MTDRERKAGRAVLWAVTAAAALAVVGWYVRDRQMEPVTPVPAAAAAGSPVLDINSATAAQLEELPGIGPALAERILDYRAENGAFSGPEALQEVSGVGPGIWEDISPFVYFGEEEPEDEDLSGR